jgi:transposase
MLQPSSRAAPALPLAAEILQIAWRAERRLHRTHTRLRAHGKHANVATVAAARELAGFIWAAATA